MAAQHCTHTATPAAFFLFFFQFFVVPLVVNAADSLGSFVFFYDPLKTCAYTEKMK